MKKISAAFLSVLLSLSLWANSPLDKKHRTVRAYRVQERIKIDGFLREKVWENPGFNDFVMSEPEDGGKPTETTVVWVAYDDDALYVAARLYDSEPDKIVGRLGRRDDRLDSDWFSFAVDPYFDRRSGFLFQVNPAGSVRDAYLYNDNWRDYSWDGVWEWAVRKDERGWTVEMKIPFSQLRFQKKDKYIWGVNFSRFIMRKQELDTFVWIPREETFTAYVSRFAELTGIEGIKPKPLVEAIPYGVSSVKFSPREEGNPFAPGRSYYSNAGLDFKLGLKSNLTLTGTINPDFGQVEVDPAVVNLTAYETYYEEKRPFFIEGSSIFEFGTGGATMGSNINWEDPQFFYSRRIGAPPHGWARGRFVKQADRTTILGAGKLTGKVGHGWNLGLISALTSREYAEIWQDGKTLLQEIEPLSLYNVARVQKEFDQGARGLGFIATGVFRDLRDPDLASSLAKKSMAFGLDGWSFLDEKRRWVVSGWFGTSYVVGNRDFIFSLQQSPLHYFQRPDASHLHLDPEAESLSGWAGRLTLGKQGGNWLFNLSSGVISPGFEINDLGFQFRGDRIHNQAVAGYVWYHPGKVFRQKILALAGAVDHDFGGNLLEEMFFIFAKGEFVNYWGGEVMAGYKARTWDRDLTRGGPMAESPRAGMLMGRLFSDRRKPVVFFLMADYLRAKTGEEEFTALARIKWKPRSNITLALGPMYNFRYNLAQWVTRVEDPSAVNTYGVRYVFADIIQHTLSASIRVNWAFTPRLTLQAYLQPFIATGDYSRFKELAAPRTYRFNLYGEGNSTIAFLNGFYTVDPDGSGPAPSFSFFNPDFNMRSMRGTVVLRWEYRPGSTLYLVWTQKRMDYENSGVLNLGRDVVDMIKAPGDNIFLLKISYRWGT